MSSNSSRLTTVEDSYASTSYVDSAVVTTGAINLLIVLALTGYATTSELSATTQNLDDLTEAVVDAYVPYPLDWVTYTSLGNSLSTYVDGKIGAYSSIVVKPNEWLSYPPTVGSPVTLKIYTEKKIQEDIFNLLDGGYDHLHLRNDAINLNGDRVGTQLIDFLRTTASESFGANECADWRLTTNSTCGFDVYRKATHLTLGSMYDGNVIEFKADGDVNIPKAGGLFIDDDDVATITDVTDRTYPLDYNVSQLVTTTNDHSSRITTVDGTGYVTQSSLTNTLSTYATASSLGTTNTTVGNIDTRLTTVENAGYVTASGLSGYGFATEGYVQSNLPTATDILTTTSVTASVSTGSTAGVAVTNTTNGVNLTFTLPQGATGG